MIEACFLTKDCDFILVRLWKNELPVALRYIQLTDAQDIFPTLSLFANGGFVSCEVITPNRIEALPTYFVSINHHKNCPSVERTSTHGRLVNQVP